MAAQRSRKGDRRVKFGIRRAFKKFGLEPTGELFDRAYAYVAEHYRAPQLNRADARECRLHAVPSRRAGLALGA